LDTNSGDNYPVCYALRGLLFVALCKHFLHWRSRTFYSRLCLVLGFWNPHVRLYCKSVVWQKGRLSYILWICLAAECQSMFIPSLLYSRVVSMAAPFRDVKT